MAMWTLDKQKFKVLNTAYRTFASNHGAGFVDVTIEVSTDTLPDKLELWLLEDGETSAPPASRRERHPFVAETTGGVSFLVSARFPVASGKYQVVVGDGSDGSASTVKINV
jgi:hypothetical protein